MNWLASIQPSTVRKLEVYIISLLRHFFVKVFNKNQTHNYLRTYELTVGPEHQLVIPAVSDASNPTKILFANTSIHVAPSFVWRIQGGNKKATLLDCGSVLFDKKLLLTDYTIDASINLFTHHKRAPYQATTLIAPWSQFFEETPSGFLYKRWITFRGYYDFMMLVAAKLCRIKDALSEQVFAQSIVAYPLLNTAFEQDFLTLIGFRPEQILDSQLYNVSFDTCLLGDSNSWCYPNITDVMSLKRNVERRVSVERTHQNRIYIRRTGRRRVLNEEDLIRLLKTYDFTIIDDVPRSIAEQVSIYKNAAFIVGPHGASFTNIIWCEPGAHLFELFNAEYVPDYFLYLSKLMNLRYSGYCSGTRVGTNSGALTADITVSISEVEECLQRLLIVS